jgi:hypothetical protein
MQWLAAVLLVLSPAILYGVALTVAALVTALYRPLCPACGRRGLVCVNRTLATVVVNGRRAPDSWTFYACEHCGAGFKYHRGAMSSVSADEIRTGGTTGDS